MQNKLSPRRAILFDLDDTLLDSFDARVEALQSVFRHAEIHHPTAEEFLRSLYGGQLEGALTKLATSRGLEFNLFEHYRRTYWLKRPGTINLYPGIKTVLEELHLRGVKLGVVTQKIRVFEIEEHRVGASEELAELGIADLFSVIVGFEDVKNHKPHPEGISLAVSRLGVSPGETLVVGDSAADIEAALAAKCWSCHATWGIPTFAHELDSIEADIVAETPETLLGLIIHDTAG